MAGAASAADVAGIAVLPRGQRLGSGGVCKRSPRTACVAVRTVDVQLHSAI